MNFIRQISRRLHEEHDATLQLCVRIEHTLSGRAGAWPPGPYDASTMNFMRSAVAALDGDVARHFQFEETELFPRLAQAGDGELAQLLAEEHATIREVARRFTELQQAASQGMLDAAGWQQLRVHGLELAERLAAHAQKEEMSLLPALDDVLDEDADRELFAAYALD